MFASLAAKVPADRDLPARAHTLDVLSRVLNGTLYDVLASEFFQEKTDAGEYVPLAQRKPSVRSNLPRIVVEDSVALLFGEGRFPDLDCKDEAVRESLLAVTKDARLQQVMAQAAITGSVGSVVILMRVLSARVYFEPMDTVYLMPEWQPARPDDLLRVTEKYKVSGAVLRAQGYAIADNDTGAVFWFQRIWDAAAETWFLPWKVLDEKATAKVDPGRTVAHSLGFVPMVWIRNLPGGDGIDGGCTFRQGIDTCIEIDYQLSQAGRGLKYSSDPTLLIKEPSGENPHIGGAANALIVAADGDAKLLEINGTASAAQVEYVRALRDVALEAMHGNRSNADKLSAAQSGRALELLHQPLIWLADRLRGSYGEDALLRLLGMVQTVSRKLALELRTGVRVAAMADVAVSLRWPPWFPPTAEDKQAQAVTLVALRNGGLMSRETAIKTMADAYDIEDVAAELLLIQADELEADARLARQAAQTKAAETVP